MNLECPYCECPVFDAADAERFGGRYLHHNCHKRFLREWDEAFGDSLDETVQEIAAGHLYEEMADTLRYAA